MKHTPAVICGRMPFINEYDESRLLETGQHPDTFRNYLKKHEPYLLLVDYQYYTL